MCMAHGDTSGTCSIVATWAHSGGNAARQGPPRVQGGRVPTPGCVAAFVPSHRAEWDWRTGASPDRCPRAKSSGPDRGAGSNFRRGGDSNCRGWLDRARRRKATCRAGTRATGRNASPDEPARGPIRPWSVSPRTGRFNGSRRQPHDTMRILSQPSRILITGATGVVGGLIAPALAGTGAQLRMLTHRTAPSPALRAAAPEAEFVPGDLERAETLGAVVLGCDVVVHAAARAGFVTLDRDRQRRVNVDGCEALLDAAAAAGVRTFVLIGYSGTVQEREDSAVPVDEETPPEGEYEAEAV